MFAVQVQNVAHFRIKDVGTHRVGPDNQDLGNNPLLMSEVRHLQIISTEKTGRTLTLQL